MMEFLKQAASDTVEYVKNAADPVRLAGTLSGSYPAFKGVDLTALKAERLVRASQEIAVDLRTLWYGVADTERMLTERVASVFSNVMASTASAVVDKRIDMARMEAMRKPGMYTKMVVGLPKFATAVSNLAIEDGVFLKRSSAQAKASIDKITVNADAYIASDNAVVAVKKISELSPFDFAVTIETLDWFNMKEVRFFVPHDGAYLVSVDTGVVTSANRPIGRSIATETLAANTSDTMTLNLRSFYVIDAASWKPFLNDLYTLAGVNNDIAENDRFVLLVITGIEIIGADYDFDAYIDIPFDGGTIWHWKVFGNWDVQLLHAGSTVTVDPVNGAWADVIRLKLTASSDYPAVVLIGGDLA